MVDKKKLGEMLVEKGLIDEMQLQSAIGKQKQWGGRLGANLVKLGYIGEITLLKFLSSQLKFPCADLSKIMITDKIYSIISIEVAKQHHVIPLDLKEIEGKKVLFLAMSEPTNFVAIDEIAFLTNHNVKPVIATNSQIHSAIKKYYEGKGWVEIAPLKEKVETTEYGNLEIVHHVPIKENKEIREKKASIKNTELLALVRVLVKKGVISRADYDAELKDMEELISKK